MTENALKAKSNGVRPPFGYYVDDTDHYQIDESLAPIVKEIFTLYLDGIKGGDIAKRMNERGIKNRGYAFNYNSIFRILTNRKYIGEYKFGDIVIPNVIPTIINSVQQRMARNKKAPAMHRSEDNYLLTTNVVYANGHTKSKFELKQPYQCKAKSREKIILAAFGVLFYNRFTVTF